ncbi:MAG: hypothetical protein RIB45_10455 [Marivibrio sp.]|uniref:hypothetical protein n=1 Tax=Marivibrio sp. TaxID=2039719 RepID=UPI0032EAA0DC
MSEVHFLSSRPSIITQGLLPLSDSQHARIGMIWETAIRARPDLTDDRVLVARSIEPPAFHCAVTSYRTFIACREDAELAQDLALRPVAVSGVLQCADGLVFGRRGKTVSQDPGMWELAPSGTLTPDATLESQIRTELDEEIGPIPAEIDAPVGWLEDTQSGVIDFLLPIRTPLDAAALHRLPRTPEYPEIAVAADPIHFLTRQGELAANHARLIVHALYT